MLAIAFIAAVVASLLGVPVPEVLVAAIVSLALVIAVVGATRRLGRQPGRGA